MTQNNVYLIQYLKTRQVVGVFSNKELAIEAIKRNMELYPHQSPDATKEYFKVMVFRVDNPHLVFATDWPKVLREEK